jgi:deoxyribose-phosphate aldolase
MGLFNKSKKKEDTAEKTAIENKSAEKIEISKFAENILEEKNRENFEKAETETEKETISEVKVQPLSEMNLEDNSSERSNGLRSATGETEEDLKKEFELFKIQKILHRIDHTLLKQNITHEDLKKLCQDATHYGFYSVCVQPIHVNFVKRQLGEGSKIKVCAVISFPFGEDLFSVKAFQTKKAISDGADEIDMVMCISALKRGDFRFVKRDIRAVVKSARKRPVKVIIETSLLTVKEIEQACSCIIGSGATFVKTSTGYFGEGATVQIIKQLRLIVKDKLSIKASGGIKTADDAVSLLNAGADRLGTSNGVAIAEGLKAGSPY